MGGPVLDYEILAQQLLRALRGHRSQVQWSRWLGYTSNVAYAWESGRRFPTATEAMRAMQRAHVEPSEALERFFTTPPAWLVHTDLAHPDGLVRLMHELKGQMSVSELARRAELSRHQVSRWMSGRTQPRLPDFLRLVQGSSLRVVDFVSVFVDPSQVPEVAELWRRLEARRTGAALHPWTQAVVRVLELDAYLALPTHDDGFVARRIGVDEEEVRRCLEFLVDTGQIDVVDGRYAARSMAVDTRAQPWVGRSLKAHWSRVAAERVEGDSPGQFSYNVFSVSHDDFERIRKLHLDYFRALRAIVGDSKAADVVAVANVQLFPLDGVEVAS
jgi:DNA-binding transcriptional regulator YiaG